MASASRRVGGCQGTSRKVTRSRTCMISCYSVMPTRRLLDTYDAIMCWRCAGPATTHYPLTTTPCFLLTPHYSLLTTHYLLITNHYSLLTTYYPLTTTHYSLLTTHYSLLTTHHPLPTAYYPLSTTYYSLNTTHYPLLTAYYPLPTTHYSLLTTHYSPLTTNYPLPTTQYPLPTTQYLPLTTHYSLLTIHYSYLTTLQEANIFSASAREHPRKYGGRRERVPLCNEDELRYVALVPQMHASDSDEEGKHRQAEADKESEEILLNTQLTRNTTNRKEGGYSRSNYAMLF